MVQIPPSSPPKFQFADYCSTFFHNIFLGENEFFRETVTSHLYHIRKGRLGSGG